MTDPGLAIIDLLKDRWAAEPKPMIAAGWYEASANQPQVTVTHQLTRPEALGFTSTPGAEKRRITCIYAVDVWSRGQAERHLLLSEVDRIIHSGCMSPGGGLEFTEVSDWRDLDEPGPPRLYRSQVRVEVLYYG